jgi:cell surface protein SprA
MPALGEVALAEGARVPMEEFHRELIQQSFRRIWAERSRQSVNAVVGGSDIGGHAGGGYQFNLPVHLPSVYHTFLGPGGPAINVSGSENVKLSGTSEWSNQQTGLIGQRRSLFLARHAAGPDIRLEGQLSDRVKVNLLQNSATQIPLANKIAINYRGEEDDLVQSLDLGNTNLTLPGTQYVSYSGRNEGLFGMKATTRLGPLDFTMLASKQEGKSERASYAGGASARPRRSTTRLRARRLLTLYDPNSPGRGSSRGDRREHHSPLPRRWHQHRQPQRGDPCPRGGGPGRRASTRSPACRPRLSSARTSRRSPRGPRRTTRS